MNRSIFFCFAIIVLLAGHTLCAPSCTTVYGELSPCLRYIQGQTNQPSSGCCSGVSAVAGQMQNRADRQAVCECLKQGLSKAGSYDASRIPKLSKQCGVSVTLPPISPTTDCSKVFMKHMF